MLNFVILDIAIGLIFIFLLLSMVCSALNEMLESLLRMRAKDLERGLRELLQDNPGSAESTLEKFYKHPLISCMYAGDYTANSTANLPSYVPSKDFALALMDLVLPAGPSDATNAGTPSGAAGATKPASTDANQANPTPLKALRDAVGQFPNDKVRGALLPLIDAAGNDVLQARANIESWYNSTMDRVSGWYKRRVQWIIVVLGVVVAVAGNVDTITIVNSLSNDSALRSGLVAAAQEYAKAPQPPADDKTKTPTDKLDEKIKSIEKLGLPIGWVSSETTAQKPVNWISKIFGWLITATAVSVGAPFWFDLLNKVISVRATVKPEEKDPKKS